MKSKAKKTSTIIISILLWIVILIAALYSITILVNKDGQNVSSVAGFTPLVIESNSMSPTFNKGDMIIVKSCDTSKLVEGDIITFHTIINNEYALNTHRIVEIKTNEVGYRSYVTRGDNNAVSDDHILQDGDIVGKHLATIPKLGEVMNVLSSSVGFLIIIVLPMLLFFIYQLYHLITVVLALKKATALEALKEQARLKIELEEQARRKREDKTNEAESNEANGADDKKPEKKAQPLAQPKEEPKEEPKEDPKSELSPEERLAAARAALQEARKAQKEAEAALARLREDKDK